VIVKTPEKKKQRKQRASFVRLVFGNASGKIYCPFVPEHGSLGGYRHNASPINAEHYESMRRHLERWNLPSAKKVKQAVKEGDAARVVQGAARLEPSNRVQGQRHSTLSSSSSSAAFGGQRSIVAAFQSAERTTHAYLRTHARLASRFAQANCTIRHHLGFSFFDDLLYALSFDVLPVELLKKRRRREVAQRSSLAIGVLGGARAGEFQDPLSFTLCQGLLGRAGSLVVF
jgi:hypothetical protein